MTENPSRTTFTVGIGIILMTVGVAVFGIRLLHAGPYATPHGAALYGAIGLLILGGFLIWNRQIRRFGWLALALSPVALFPALYSIMGESEEVISLYARDADGAVTDLRLWIIDREDGAWVGMPRAKATKHELDGARLEMLRSGDHQCVSPKLYEDRSTVNAIHKMKVDKYVVAQIFGSIGFYPLEATPNTVALRLDPCL